MKIKLSFLQILSIVLLIILTFWLFYTGSWGYAIIVLPVIFLQIFYFIRKQIFIPKLNSTLEICPNCKNPNANRSTTCEWYGGQII